MLFDNPADFFDDLHPVLVWHLKFEQHRSNRLQNASLDADLDSLCSFVNRLLAVDAKHASVCQIQRRHLLFYYRHV